MLAYGSGATRARDLSREILVGARVCQKGCHCNGAGRGVRMVGERSDKESAGNCLNVSALQVDLGLDRHCAFLVDEFTQRASFDILYGVDKKQLPWPFPHVEGQGMVSTVVRLRLFAVP